MASISLEEVRELAKKSGVKVQNTETEKGGTIIAECNGPDQLDISVGLDRPYVRQGVDKVTKQPWYKILFATTIKSRFLKTLVVQHPDGRTLRVQVEVSEQLPK